MNNCTKNESLKKRLHQSCILDSFNKLREQVKKKKLLDSGNCETNLGGLIMCENSEVFQERSLPFAAVEKKRLNAQGDGSYPEHSFQKKYEVASSSRATDEEFYFAKYDNEYIDSLNGSPNSRSQMQFAKNINESSCNSDASQILFSDSDSSMSSKDVLCMSSIEVQPLGKGIPLSQLTRTFQCSQQLLPLRPALDHIIFFRVPLKENELPRPYPENYRDVWDGNHVRMPCSSENLYPIENNKGEKKLENRWELIQRTLLGDINSSLDLEEAIITYNARYSTRWDFSGLHYFFTEVLSRSESEAFFSKTLPAMVRLALQLPSICTQPIPLLKKQQNCTLTFSQQQIACLLANAFFCTFPRRNAKQRQSEYYSFPDINFNTLFAGSFRGGVSKGVMSKHQAEKWKCILNYFRRVTSVVPTGTVSFKRQSLDDMPQWEKSSKELLNLHVTCHGTIENDGLGMLQVDFANKFVGGGVLRKGCVQEEIRFIICPEMLVSRLFTEELENNECLIMTGCERYNDYEGYASSFIWAGNHVDQIPRDSWGRRHTEVVAIDALHFIGFSDQFHSTCVKRELNKAYCGFYSHISSNNLSAVATGNWGCGAFRGDARLKALIQLMAAAETHRDVVYFTFNDEQLQDDIFEMYNFLKENKKTVGDIWSLIQKYYFIIGTKSKNPAIKLYPFIYKVLRT